MTERSKSPSQQARSARLSKALRENLKRRKAQSRGRSGTEKGGDRQNPGRQRPDG